MISPKRPGKYLIGLTGNIGTGKSTVMEILRHLGARTIDADQVAHEVMRRESVKEAIIREFGPQVLKSDGEIDRLMLGQIVFKDAGALQRLEAIVHPAVKKTVKTMIEEAPECIVIVEAIKLIESGMYRDCDALWVVTAPPEQQLARLMRERGMGEEEAWRRIRAQGPQEAKIALADVVIHNDGTRENLERQVRAAWEAILGNAPAAKNEVTR